MRPRVGGSCTDANNLNAHRRVLADCEQVFEDVGSGASWNRPGLNRLKAALQPGDCAKVAALDRLGRSLPEVLDLLGGCGRTRSRSSVSGSPLTRTAPLAGRCCTRPSSSRRWSGSRPLASTWAGASGSAGSGPRRYSTCANATASRGAASR